MGVRVAVGVADSATMNASIRAVLAAEVDATARSVVGVEDGTVAVGCGGCGVCEAVGGDVKVGAMVSSSGGV